MLPNRVGGPDNAGPRHAAWGRALWRRDATLSRFVVSGRFLNRDNIASTVHNCTQMCIAVHNCTQRDDPPVERTCTESQRRGQGPPSSSSPSRRRQHCHSTLSSAIIARHCFGIYTVILRSLLSFSVAMAVSPRAVLALRLPLYLDIRRVFLRLASSATLFVHPARRRSEHLQARVRKAAEMHACSSSGNGERERTDVKNF